MNFSKNTKIAFSIISLSAIMLAPNVAMAASLVDDTALQQDEQKTMFQLDKSDEFSTFQEKAHAMMVKRTSAKAQIDALKNMYKNYIDDEDIAALDSLTDEISTTCDYDALEAMDERINSEKEVLQNKKQQKIKEEEERKAAEEAVRQKAEALAALKQKQANSNTNYSSMTTETYQSAGDAKSFIIQKESGGNYNAQNGRYYGAYQLDSSYLNGDYSQENQDRVAENYVSNRYGSWEAAKSFWEQHGWY